MGSAYSSSGLINERAGRHLWCPFAALARCPPEKERQLGRATPTNTAPSEHFGTLPGHRSGLGEVSRIAEALAIVSRSLAAALPASSRGAMDDGFDTWRLWTPGSLLTSS